MLSAELNHGRLKAGTFGTVGGTRAARHDRRALFTKMPAESIEQAGAPGKSPARQIRALQWGETALRLGQSGSGSDFRRISVV
jgi:hypothetical protein